MKRLIASLVACSLSLASNAMAQNLILGPGQSYTVLGNESYGKLDMALGSSLTIPTGTSITLSERSLVNGGTISLDGGSFTTTQRFDFSHGAGATLLANSGTFSIQGGGFWAFADNAPLTGDPTQLVIGDAVVNSPAFTMYIDRQPVVTFVAGGTGYFDMGVDPNQPLANPHYWLSEGMKPENAGYGLFAPPGETIQITTLANGLTRVTSVFVYAPSGNVFTWGELLADGSWGNAAGWKKNGAVTTSIPTIDDQVTGSSDEVEVLAGTVRVDTANRGAWSVDVNSGGAAVVSNGKTLRILEDLTIDGGGAVEARSGGQLTIEKNLNVAVGGLLTIHDGTVSVANNTAVQGTVAFTGTGVGPPAGGDFDVNSVVDGRDFLVWQRGGSPTPLSAVDFAAWKGNFGQPGSPLSTLVMDSGSLAAVQLQSSGVIKVDPTVGTGEVSIGQLTLGATSRLVKQGSGTLYLAQSSGANSLPAGAKLSIEQGTLVAMNNSTSNALGSGTIGLDGGNLVLTRTQATAASFNAPVQVNADGTILAAQRGAGALAGGTVTLGGTQGIAISSGAIATLETANGYTINLAGNVSGPGRLDFGDGAVVQVQGAVTTAGVGYSGNLSNVSVSGSIAPTSGYFFNPTAAHPDMTIGFPIAGARTVVIGDLDSADGSVGFTGTLAHTGVTRIQRGALRLGGTNNGPSASAIEFAAHDLNRAAVVESSLANYNPTIGTAAANVRWTGAGGFASRQGGAGTTVTVNGGAALTWDSATTGFNGQALQLGSTTANAPVILANNLNLGSAAERVIQVASNPNSAADVARITGVIASSGTSADLLRINKQSGNGFQNSLLELLGSNMFANTLRVDSGAVYAIDGTGLPTSANLQFSGNDSALETVFATQGAFTRAIGSGAGKVSWATSSSADPAKGGGFAARGGPLNVTLAGGTVLWDDPAGFNGQDLHLGSQYANNVVTFNNNLNAQSNFHSIQIFDNPNSPNDSVVINGSVSNANGLRFPGSGRVVVNGNVTGNTGVLGTGPGNVVAIFNGNQLGSPMNTDVKIEALGQSMLFLNGTYGVGEDVQTDGSPSIGGSGQVNLFGGSAAEFKIGPNAHLRPGADVNATGKLTVNLGANSSGFTASFFEMQPASTYHLELAEQGGAVVHDTVDLTNQFGNAFINGYLALERNATEGWKVDVSALESLSGLVSPADEFELFTLNPFVQLLDFNTSNFTILNAPILSGTGVIASATILPSANFNVSGATVRYDVSSSVGRVYVTGLAYTGLISNVPEPAAGLLGVVGIVAIVTRRGRRKR